MKATLWLACAMLFASWGCTTEPYCLDCMDSGRTGDGGSDVDVVRSDGARDTATDIADTGDSTPCNPLNLADDPRNCGACGNVCAPPHAIPMCANGMCVLGACDVGWLDLDNNPANGCEYNCIPTGPEVCDGVDNDCNGQIDEGFNRQTDPMNCGTCGNVCADANGTPVCMAGVCTLGGCLTGFADINHDATDGCEYHCPVYPPLPYEVCNGLDDNCDGHIDEASALEAAPTTLCVTTPGTPCAGTTAACQTRGGVTTWYCNYGAGVEFDPTLPNGLVAHETRCDGVDNDCNGAIDDTFPAVGGPCDNALLGACRDVGIIRCNPADVHATICDLSVLPDPTPGAPHAETCNNLDDNCDGIVDNTTGPNRVMQDMVHITAGGSNFYMDRYEASRPDATSASAGVVNARTCSVAGAVPWTLVNYANAQSACAAAGFRLCTAAEWTTACASAANTLYPYGNTYQPTTCNGADYGTSHALIPTGDPSTAMCVAANGVHDLSGNVKEWTNDPQGMTSATPPVPIYTVRGGGYESPQLGLTCSTTFSRASGDTTLGDIGFRCCSSMAP